MWRLFSPLASTNDATVIYQRLGGNALPIIRPQHENDPWRPLQAWPDSTHVQWGGKGVVFGKSDAYTTAFFEAFPRDGTAGFLRGEGQSIEAAEEAAFAQWSRFRTCLDTGGHRWGRTRILGNGKTSTYTNGGCFCRRCGSFQTVMPVIVALGEYKQPLSTIELESIASGFCRANTDRESDKRAILWRRRMALRAKVAGIDLPPITPRDPTLNPFASDDYSRGCRKAVRAYCLNHPDWTKEGGDGIFDHFSRAMLRSLIDVDDED
jgi:hypothetical protein